MIFESWTFTPSTGLQNHPIKAFCIFMTDSAFLWCSHADIIDQLSVATNLLNGQGAATYALLGKDDNLFVNAFTNKLQRKFPFLRQIFVSINIEEEECKNEIENYLMSMMEKSLSGNK